jgi:hypothetical protein
MDLFAQLLKEKSRILEQIGQLGPTRRGSVCEFQIACVRKDGSRRARGPYLKYTLKKNNKTVGKHLRDAREAQLYRQQIARHRRFEELVGQFALLSERLADLEVSQMDAKKNSRS